ncbi:hypothetical protein [Planotetraspora kaengkrachanensis]|uniref:Alcohol dehydrogenase-like C-terminal domain-containing protein n=1 Tax=Planotetraspora kaengkrachanensis TaxID=575193 RepID=A0A8J3PZ91_9ACTN|nr:hypothetical protein [Planotetraspora kaengkrachanensis]GIG83837.1 hypothetical protein Pka01_69640 [Planotetraspora kaengkrachanensis]
MPTVLHALDRLGGIRYGQNVVVQGSGPVGLAATLLAHIAGAGSVTLASSVRPTPHRERRFHPCVK